MDTKKDTDTEATATPAELGMGLAVAVSRLRARMRSEAGDPGQGITVSQVAMMRRLIERGPMTASQLAATEHVSQQAISQRLELLAPTGYLVLAPDEADRRRKLVSVTEKGRAFLESLAAGDEEWLSRAIASAVGEEELPALANAVELLERIASVDMRSRGRLR